MARAKLDVEQIGWSEAITKSIKLGTTDLGTELVTNGTFDSDASSWSLGTDWAYDSGKLTKSAGSGYTYSALTQTLSGVSSGTLYLIQFTISNVTTASNMLVKLGNVSPSTAPMYVGGNGANTYTQLIKAGGTSLEISSIGSSTAFSIDSISVKEVYAPTDGQVALWSSQELDGTESSLHITSEDGTTHTFGETVSINSFNNYGNGILSVHSRNNGENWIVLQNDRHGFVDWALHNDSNNLVIQQAPTGTPIDVMTFKYDASTPKVGIGTSSPTEVLDIDADAIRLRDSQTPASATATGTAGMICWDTNYVYVCVATNTWKRSALSTW